MTLISDSLILLVWVLLSIIIIFLYIDVRVGKLRKELLTHYALCEKMVSTILRDRQGGNDPYRCDVGPYSGYSGNSWNSSSVGSDIFPRVVPATVDDDFIPTRDEMTQGMQRLNSSANQRDSWLQPVASSGIHAFDNWEFQGGDYAPFRLS